VYPFVFDGDIIWTTKPSNVPLDATEIYTKDLFFDDSDEEVEKEENGTIMIPFAQIGEDGCEYCDRIILYGNQAGTVWACDQSSCRKKYESFEEYIYAHYFRKRLV
jgi:hypothetical protein